MVQPCVRPTARLFAAKLAAHSARFLTTWVRPKRYWIKKCLTTKVPTIQRLTAQGRLLAVILLCASSPNLSAGETLAPYTASYKTTAMGLGMTLHRELSLDPEGGYTLSNKGRVLFLSIEETARFRITDNRIMGERFDYKLGGLASRKRAVRFEPERGVIQSLRKKQWTEVPWAPDVYDRLSQQEQLRLELMAGDSPPAAITFKVIDGPRVRERVIEWVGSERVTVPAGSFDTWHFRQLRDNDERASDIWVAPDLAYLMVLTRHREDNTVISIELLDTSLDTTSR